MGDTTYPTDELSHPEYVNDDFRMFTFKVGETGVPLAALSLCPLPPHDGQRQRQLCMCCTCQ